MFPKDEKHFACVSCVLLECDNISNETIFGIILQNEDINGGPLSFFILSIYVLFFNGHKYSTLDTYFHHLLSFSDCIQQAFCSGGNATLVLIL